MLRGIRMKILIIEDKREDVREIEDHAKEKEWEIRVESFQNGVALIDSFNPDVVVLDRKDDLDSDDKRGEGIFNLIWKDKFRPTIVFSGMAESFEIAPKYAKWAAEPLFTRISKGDEAPVIDQLDKLEKVAPVLSVMRLELNEALIVSASALTKIGSLTSRISDEVMKYLFANRVEQYFQAKAFDESLPAWFQYTYPPISSHLLTGDIMESVNVDAEGQHDYLLILTPSCDMANSDSTYILAAHSANFSCIDDAYSVKYDITKRKEKEKSISRANKVKSIMNSGFKGSKVFLPAIHDVLPNLCFDMKQIETIPLNQLEYVASSATADKKWIRKASLASPYRERVTWAYLSTACRPGVPTLNVDEWVEEIFK